MGLPHTNAVHCFQLKRLNSKVTLPADTTSNVFIPISYILETLCRISANLSFQNHPDGGRGVAVLLE
jgi:hypothetical protein